MYDDTNYILAASDALMLIFTIATMAAVRGILLFVLMLDGVLSLQCPSQKNAEVLIFGAGTAGVTVART